MLRPFAKAVLCVALALAAPPVLADSLNWRGTLADQGQPANGLFDLKLALYASADSIEPLATDMVLFGVRVVDGAFEVPIEVPTAVAQQSQLFGQMSVRPSGAKMFDTLPTRIKVRSLGGVCWNTSGNGGLDSGSFLGTTDSVPLELRTNNARVGQIIGYAPSPSVQLGHASNAVALFAAGATISGGGASSAADPNFGTVGPNRVTDGFGTVGGGSRNVAGNSLSTVFDAAYATVGGGQSNTASGAGATVAGGGLNVASGTGAAIPGGTSNTASGDNALAAGRRAKALHDGAMVFADSTNADFSSTGANQILLRANGGVGVGVTAPLGKMHLKGATAATRLGQVQPNRETEMVIEDTDAMLQLISTQAGTYGSTIALTDSTADGTDGTSWYIYKRANTQSIGFGFGVGDSMLGGVQVYDFGANGTALKPGGGSWGVMSDARLKHNVKPLSGALNTLLGLHGVEFEYNADAVARGLAKAGPQIGFIAQEVATVLPQWVGTSNDGYQFVAETGTTALLVEALRELNQNMIDLQQQNAALHKRLAALESAQ